MKRNEHKAQALEMRLAGWSFPVIAKELGCATQTAHNYVTEALDERVTPAVEQIRKEMLEQLDALMTGVWNDAVNGNLGALSAVLALMQRKAKLIGADVPVEVRTRSEVSVDGTVSVGGQIDHVVQAPLRIVFVKPDGKEIEGSLVPPKLTNGHGSEGNGHG